MDSTKKKVVHHLKKALAEMDSTKSRSRSSSPVRAEKKEKGQCRKKTGEYKKCKEPKKK